MLKIALISALVFAFFGMCVALAEDARSEPLAIVVVAKNSPLTDVSMAELTRIFRGEEAKAPDGTHFVVTMREKGSDEREAALRQIYQMSEAEYAKYFLQATFMGTVNSAPKVTVGAAGMKRFINNNPGAIGYLRLSDMDASVKALTIDRRKPGDSGYALMVP